MKRTISAILALLTMLSVISVCIVPASAAVAWPSLSSKSYCEYTATGTINVYRNAECTTRGTYKPAKSYNAYVEKDDVCRIIKITSDYILMEYPTSSGYKTGYVRRSSVLSVKSPTEKVTSKGKTDTYKKASNVYYGYVDVNDKVWAVGTSGNYTKIIYTAKSGNRAYKIAYVPTKNYNAIIKGSASKKTTTPATNTSKSSYSLSSKDKNGYRTLTVNGVSLTEYKVGSKYTSSRYAVIGNASVDMAAWQCMGYARYVQYKLYGAHWATAPKKFPNLKGSEKVYPDADGYRDLITQAGVGAHIRTREKQGVVAHSMIVIDVTADGFTITDANSDNKNTIRVKTYTWNEYAKSTFGKRGLQYIEIYKG